MAARNIGYVIPTSALTLSLWLLTSQAGAGAAPPNGLAGVKALYAAAEYEAALIVLSTDAVASTAGADQYRALCLLALGRSDEVEALLESLVRRDPSFRMSVAEVTPRMISLFQHTRRRLLPRILDDTFTTAKANFEQRRYAEASSQFRTVLTLLADEDAASEDGTIVTRDLQRIAESYLNLAATALAEGSQSNRPVDGASAALVPKPDDETAIRRVVQEYAEAYSDRDADAVARVFQGENPRPLRAMFDALKSQTVKARDVKVTVDEGAWSATVTLTWAVHAVPKVGSPRKTQMPVTLRMLKVVTGEWCIVARR